MPQPRFHSKVLRWTNHGPALPCCWRESTPIAQELFQKVRGRAELCHFARGQGSEMGSEILDAALASLLKKTCSLCGSVDVYAARVAGITSDLNQKATLESSDDPAHGRRLDLLCSGEIPKRFGAPKNQDRQG